MRLALIAALALGFALAGCGDDTPGVGDGGDKDAGADSGRKDMTQPPADGPEDHDGPAPGDGPVGEGTAGDGPGGDGPLLSDAALADLEPDAPPSDAALADMVPPSDAALADMVPMSDAALADMEPDAPMSDAALADMTTTDAPMSDAALADAVVDAPPPDVGPDGPVLSDAALADVIMSDAALADLTPGTTECTDLVDNDGDGLIDHMDPECTGALDNDEGSFGTGIPGDNKDCKQDCFFDGNSGGGGGDCTWQIGCDPLDTTCKDYWYQPNDQPCDDSTNPCTAKYYCQDGYCLSTTDCIQAQDPACLESCLARTPNGCDCFGCCSFQYPDGSGSVSVRLVETCATKFMFIQPGGQACNDTTNPCTNDTTNCPTADDCVCQSGYCTVVTKCPLCTPSDACENECGVCELCRGKTELPPECYPDAGTPVGECPSGWQWCGTNNDPPCGVGYWCLDGCCAPAD